MDVVQLGEAENQFIRKLHHVYIDFELFTLAQGWNALYVLVKTFHDLVR